MAIIDMNKVKDVFVLEIRDDFNIQEKIELVRMLMNSIEYDHNEIMKSVRGRG